MTYSYQSNCALTKTVQRTLIALLFILLSHISSTPSCPPRCSSCQTDSAKQLITATCTDAKLQSMPNSLVELHVRDAGPWTVPLGKLLTFYLAGKANLRILTMHNYRITLILDRAFMTCTKLETLDLSKNHIYTVSSGTFTGLTHLVYLNLNSNDIADVAPKAFKDMVLLKELNLGLNKLTMLKNESFAGLTNLTTLNIQSNAISDIQAGVFTGLHNVESINLENNNLTSIVSGTFSNLQNLHSLNLKRNHLRHLAEDSLHGLSLTILNLAQNNLTNIPTQVLQHISNNIVEVNLATNQISTIYDGDFKNVTLKSLFLISNDLSLVQPDALKDSFIQKLDLQQNKLHSLPEHMLLYLNQSKELLLSNNLWLCDCDIQWLTNILKDDSTVCSQPANLKGSPIRQIKNDLQVTCNNPSSVPVPTSPFPVPSQQALVTPVLKNLTEYNELTGENPLKGSDSNNTAIVVSVVVVVILLFLIAMAIVMILISRSRKVSDLNINCRKPDINFKPRLPRLPRIA